MDEVDICRICTNFTASSSSTNLFEKKQRQLLSQIKDVTGCALKNNKDYPKFICEHCEKSLKQALLFRKRCRDAQKYFNSETYKESLHRKPNLTLDTETDEQDVVTVYIAEDEYDELAGDHDKDTKENVKNILFEPDKHVINTLLKGSDFLPNESVLQTNNAGDSSDDITLNDIIKREHLNEAQASTKQKTKSKQTNKTSNNKLMRKTVGKVKKEKTANEKRDFMCDQCGNHFTCRHHFTTHLRRHANDKRYPCEICPAKFFTHCELKRHMRRHTGERPFECKHCKRRFTDFSTRVKHERIHTNERPFKCDQCGKAFTTSYVLKNHMLVHTGERSFKCEICDKAFQRQVHLDVHCRSLLHKQMLENALTKTEVTLEN